MNSDPENPPLARIDAFAIAFGAIAGLAGTALGAWATHGAPTEFRGWLATAGNYALFHGLAMIAAAMFHDRIARQRWPCRLITGCLVAFAAGIILFSGGIFLAVAGIASHTAPIGGTLLMIGWIALAAGGLAAFRGR